MLKGERVSLRSMERDDMKRLQELYQNVDVVVMADGEWQPLSLAAREKQFDKNLENRFRADFAIEADDKVIGEVILQWGDQRSRVAHLTFAIYDPAYLNDGYDREALALFAAWA